MGITEDVVIFCQRGFSHSRKSWTLARFGTNQRSESWSMPDAHASLGISRLAKATHLHWTEKDRIKINLHSRECILQRLKRLHRAAILADTPEDFRQALELNEG